MQPLLANVDTRRYCWSTEKAPLEVAVMVPYSELVMRFGKGGAAR